MRTPVAISRRDFLALVPGAGIAVAVGYYARGSNARAQGGDGRGLQGQLEAFVSVEADGSVRVLIPRSEIGQGTHSGLAMVAADGLDADWSSVVPIQPGFDRRLGRQNTGASSGIMACYELLRHAGATTRAMLVAAAAQQWGVEPGSCGTEPGVVVHGPSGRRAAYGALAAAAARLPVPSGVPLEDPATFRLIGTPQLRKDVPLKIDGSAVFGMDVRVPGMLYASIVRCPEFGGSLERFDATRAKAVPGVQAVVELPRAELLCTVGQAEPRDMRVGAPGHHHFLRPGVAVLAENTWAAMQGRRALQVTWKPGPQASLSSAGLSQQFQALLKAPAQSVVQDRGDVDATFRSAARIVQAEYELPLLAHATMEPQNATASVTDDRVDIWAPSQSPAAIVGSVAHVLNVPVDKVNAYVTFSGGGFGRRGQPDVVVEAALLSKAVGVPIKVVWTREDDIQHDYYRPSGRQRVAAALDAQGRMVGFRQHEAHLSMNQFFRGPGVPTGEISADDFPAFAVPHVRLESSVVDADVRLGPWRSVANSTNCFVLESFLDEVAVATGRDPVALRLSMLDAARATASNEQRTHIDRLATVIRLVEARAGWGTTLPRGRARGFAAFPLCGSYAAQVVDISIARSKVRVHRVVCVVDAGTIVNPDSVIAQIEGGIVYGLSAVLMGAITLKRGRPEQSNFHDYRMMRIGDAPAIDVHIVPSTARPTGIGEVSVPHVMPAVTNAIFALTGKRIRSLPVKLA
ncbi:MAG: molybdopterin cofactor-binding domain-containing protein [Vicinamibacterales bacterium]